jgi:hypothetical protein
LGESTEWQKKPKYGPVPFGVGSAAKADLSSVLSDNPVSHPKSQTRTRCILGGNEWLEDAFRQILWDTVPRVGDRHAETLRCGMVP